MPKARGTDSTLSWSTSGFDSFAIETLFPSGWFWNDFPEPGWANAVRKLPSEDAATFERVMRDRVREAIEGDAPTETGELDPAPAERLLAIDLPEERETPPSLPVLEGLD